MARIRDPEGKRSFNGYTAGEWVTVPDDDVPYLVETYAVEVEGIEPKPESEPEPAPVKVIAGQPDPPHHKGAGWWVYQGETYRRSQLPAEAEELIDG